MRLRTVLPLLCLLLSACGGPRQDPLPRAHALRWDQVMTVRVVETWDLVEHHVDTHPAVTHVVEVVVVDGPDRFLDRTLFLPFDAWAVGVEEPPARGTETTIMPSQWVRRSRSSRGAPVPDWNR